MNAPAWHDRLRHLALGGPLGIRPTRGLLLALLLWAAGTAGVVALGERAVARDEVARVADVRRELQWAVESLRQASRRMLDTMEDLHALALLRRRMEHEGDAAAAAAIGDRLAAVARQERLGIRQIAEIDADGMLRWTTTPGWEPVDLSDREHFQVHRDGRRALFVSRPVMGRASGSWTVQFTRPILEDGHFAGVIVFSIDPRLLSRALERIHQHSGIIVGILRTADRTLIARSENAAQYIGLQPVFHFQMTEELRRDRGGFLRTRSNLDDTSSFYSFRILDEAPLVLAARTPAAVVEEPAAVFRRWVRLGVGTGSLLALAAIAILFQRRQTAATRRLLEDIRHDSATARAAWQRLDQLTSAAPAALYAAEIAAQEGAPPTGLSRNHFTGNVERVTGWPPEALAPAGSIAERTDNAGRLGRLEFLRRLAEHGEASTEYRLRRPDGSSIRVREDGRVIGREGGALQICGSLSDVTRSETADHAPLPATP